MPLQASKCHSLPQIGDDTDLYQEPEGARRETQQGGGQLRQNREKGLRLGRTGRSCPLR